MNAKTPLISVIIPTKNVAPFIEPCLNSILSQSVMDKTEIVVVDNYSTDLSRDIISHYKQVRFFEHGPERHTQRAFGVEQSRGKYLFFIDADMQLDQGLLEECLIQIQKGDCGALIIPERPVGADNFWTKCKILERSCYAGDDQVEAARFFKRDVYEEVGGFNTSMIAMEDWDLTKRVREKGYVINRTENFLSHNEGHVTLKKLWDKKKYYGGQSTQFVQEHGFFTVFKKLYFFRPAFYRNWKKLLKTPVLTMGMIVLLSVELLAGVLGVLRKVFKRS